MVVQQPPSDIELQRHIAGAVDCAPLRFRAEVDFVRVQLTLQRATNFQTLRRVLQATFVEVEDSGPGGSATDFIVRIDDPTSWAALDAVLHRAEVRFGFAEAPRLVQIEVAVDARMDRPDLLQLARLTQGYLRFNKFLCSNNLRFGKRTVEAITSASTGHALKSIFDGAVVWVGNKTDPVAQRFYVKRTDRGGKVKLAPEDWRARCEVTLQADALPFEQLGDAASFRFESLTKQGFAWRKWDEPSTGTDAIFEMIKRRVPIVGVPLQDGRRKYDRLTCADTPLNKRVYDALRELTRRMNAPRKRASKRSITEVSENQHAQTLDLQGEQRPDLLPNLLVTYRPSASGESQPASETLPTPSSSGTDCDTQASRPPSEEATGLPASPRPSPLTAPECRHPAFPDPSRSKSRFGLGSARLPAAHTCPIRTPRPSTYSHSVQHWRGERRNAPRAAAGDMHHAKLFRLNAHRRPHRQNKRDRGARTPHPQPQTLGHQPRGLGQNCAARHEGR